jgi:hypothetical protein
LTAKSAVLILVYSTMILLTSLIVINGSWWWRQVIHKVLNHWGRAEWSFYETV